ncbi:hypothetical protein [Brevibacillus laterosporus]|uniref:hypothetical protein n=1 Tax=Brevibacillus laterosporus TaxID=1465 RepID=UPI0014440163|nr:hypothetical protein [Brevibacillus laterosporus]NKQ21786.1 hypothetical protein [Brevibacillus laterosporus]
MHNNPVSNVDPTGNWCESKDGKWAHLGGCNDLSNGGKVPYNKKDAAHDNDFIKENGVIVGIYK